MNMVNKIIRHTNISPRPGTKQGLLSLGLPFNERDLLLKFIYPGQITKKKWW